MMEDQTNFVNIPNSKPPKCFSSNVCCLSNTTDILDSTESISSDDKPKKKVFARFAKGMSRILSLLKVNKRSSNYRLKSSSTSHPSWHNVPRHYNQHQTRTGFVSECHDYTKCPAVHDCDKTKLPEETLLRDTISEENLNV